MTEMDCACAQQLNLWKTAENPVDKPRVHAGDSIPLTDIKLLTDSTLRAHEADLLIAIIDAMDILTARIDSLEFELNELIGMQTRTAPASESSGAGASPQPNQEVMDQ